MTEHGSVLLSGWATKEGGNFKTWRTRYFVLREKALLYYKTETDAKTSTGHIDDLVEPTGTIPIVKGRTTMTRLSRRGYDCIKLETLGRERDYFISPESALTPSAVGMAQWLSTLGEMTDVSKIEDDIRDRSATARSMDSVLGKLDEKIAAIASLSTAPKMDTPAALTAAALDVGRHGRYRCVAACAVWYRLPGPNDGAGEVMDADGVTEGDEVLAAGIATGPSGTEYIVLPNGGGFYVHCDPERGTPTFELVSGSFLNAVLAVAHSATPTSPPSSDAAPKPRATPTHYDITWSGNDSVVTEYTATAQPNVVSATSCGNTPPVTTQAAEPHSTSHGPTEPAADSGDDNGPEHEHEQDSDEDLL